MSVCPFCKAPVAQSTAPCPRCGKLASEHPSIAAVQGRTLNTDFDDEPQEELSLGSDGAGLHSGAAAASYDAGGVTFDDDLFGDGDGGDLELDMPNAPRPAPPPSQPRSEPLPTASGEVAVAHGDPGDPFGSVPDLPVPSSDQLRPSGSHPMPGTSGTLPAATRQAPSDPRLSAPELPASAPAGHAAVSSGRLPAGAPESGQVLVAPPARPAPPPPDPGALLVARYPTPPTKVTEMPAYACKVLWRQFELRRDLESLRRRRSPDVPLYEAALRAHDPRAFGIGLAITCTALTLGTILFFMPVILRFLRAPD